MKNQKQKNEGIVSFLDLYSQNEMTRLPAKFKILFDRSHFADNVLDVSSMYPYAEPQKCLIRFDKLPSHLYEISRIMARFQLFGGAAPATVQDYLDRLRDFFKELSRTTDILDYRFLTNEDIRHTLRKGRWSADACRKICTALDKTYAAAQAIYDRRMLSIDLDELAVLRKRYNSKSKATQEVSKTPDIDQEYFEILTERLPVIARDENVPINIRMTAAFEMLSAWTGLRASEPFTMTTDSLQMKPDTKGGEMPYLSYIPEKLTHGGRRLVKAETCALPGAEEAFRLLRELRKQIPGHGKTKKLFILDGPKSNRNALRYYSDRLFKDYLTDLVTAPWETVNTRTVKGQAIRVPSATQLRVHLCSWLYNNGISLPIIEMGMSHLVDAMHAYYVRIKDVTFDKEQKRTDNIIRTLTNNDFDIEDHPERGEALLEGLVLALKRFDVFTEQYEEMEKKGYDYENRHYGDNILGLMDGEIRPAMDYLDRTIMKEGEDAVLDRHPMLATTVKSIESYRKTFEEWRDRISAK